jgi:hypothetical protein
MVAKLVEVLQKNVFGPEPPIVETVEVPFAKP